MVIPLNRKKLAGLTVGAAALVAVSASVWRVAWFDPVAWVAAVVGMLFFGACGLYGLVKLFDPRPGLVLDHEGILDHSSGLAVGRIYWEEMTGLRVSKMYGQRLLTIDVADPRRFVRQGGAVRRWASWANMRLVGSAINISTNALAISFDELTREVTAFYETYRRR